jgi:tripartite-type tricarboxylate transporter receptor subunit TctC
LRRSIADLGQIKPEIAGLLAMTKRYSRTGTVILAALLAAPAAAQDAFPSRPVRIVVGFGPASAGDVVARVLAQRVGQSMHQQFFVETRPGAGSNIAAEYVARAPKDGYTLLLATVANTVNAAMMPRLSFDFQKDLAPVALVTAVPILLAANPQLGVRNVPALIALAKRQPDQIVYGSSGTGTAGHLAGELFNARAGVKLVHVTYPGSAQALTELIAGRIGLMFGAASTALPHVQGGELVALAMAQSKRSAIAPEVPSMAEAGLPGFDATVWFGLLAPAGTPPAIVATLSNEVNAALRSDEVIAPLRMQGMEPIGGSPAEFAAYIAAEVAKWTPVVEAAGLRK